MELSCPKCQAHMRQYERNGVTVDQCTDCRGIFLDRGELERLADAEATYYGGEQQTAPPSARPAASPPPQPAPHPEQPGYQQPPAHLQQPGYPQQPAMPYRRGWGSPGSPDSPNHYGHPGQHRRRRKSFLGELFD